MKKLNIIIALIIIGIIGMVSYEVVKFKEGTIEIPLIETEKIGDKDDVLIVNGFVQSEQTDEILYDYETYGPLEKVNVKIGDTVKKGDVLAEAKWKNIRAKFDGKVTSIRELEAMKAQNAYTDKREQTNQNPFIKMESSDLYLETEVTEFEYKKLLEQPEVKYTIRTETEKGAFSAKIREFELSPTKQTIIEEISKYKVRYLPITGTEFLQVGLHLELSINGKDDEISLNLSDVIVEGDQFYAFVVKDVTTGSAKEVHKVELKGKTVGDRFIVESGIVAGDLLAKNPLEIWQDKMMVQVA